MSLDVLVFHTPLPCPSICRRSKKLPRLLWEQIWSCARPTKARLDAFGSHLPGQHCKIQMIILVPRRGGFSNPFLSLSKLGQVTNCFGRGRANMWKGCDSHHVVRHIAPNRDFPMNSGVAHSHCALMTNSSALACFAAPTYLLVTPEEQSFFWQFSKVAQKWSWWISFAPLQSFWSIIF